MISRKKGGWRPSVGMRATEYWGAGLRCMSGDAGNGKGEDKEAGAAATPAPKKASPSKLDDKDDIQDVSILRTMSGYLCE